MKEFNFTNRSTDIWNELEAEVIRVKNIHEFKTRLDKSRYGDNTVGAYLKSCILQLGKYCLELLCFIFVIMVCNHNDICTIHVWCFTGICFAIFHHAGVHSTS